MVGGLGTLRVEHGEHFIHEEHAVLDLAAGSALSVGDRVELMPGYGPTTVNLYDIYYVVSGSLGDRYLAGPRPLWQRHCGGGLSSTGLSICLVGQ